MKYPRIDNVIKNFEKCGASEVTRSKKPTNILKVVDEVGTKLSLCNIAKKPQPCSKIDSQDKDMIKVK